MFIDYGTKLATIDGFWKLFESTGWNEEYRLSKQDLATVVRNSWFQVAAFDGDRLVAYGRIVTDGLLHAMVYDLITDRDYRGRGIGSEVLSRLVKECKRARIRDIQLFCARGQRAFYEKRGFKARNEEGPGMDYVGVKSRPLA